MIIVIAPIPPPLDGASSVSKDVVNLLTEERIAHRVFTMSPALGGGRAIYHVSRLARYLRACLGVATARRSDQIYLSLAGGWGQVYDLAVVALARLRGLNVHFHHHNFTYVDRRAATFSAIIFAAGERQFHYALCERMKELLEQQYPAIKNVSVISNEAWWPIATDIPPSEAPLRRIGFIANITREKGVLNFLDLIRELRARGSNIEGWIAGPCTDKRLLSDVLARAEFLGGVEYRGPVYGSERDAFFREIDLLVFPTAYPNEAEPLVVLEAQRLGVPVAASDRGCIASMLGSAPGLLLDRDGREIASLADKIIMLSENPTQMAHLRQSVRSLLRGRTAENSAARSAFLFALGRR
ncbi:glycosyltransferase family 4 protein [Aquamicrobium zhengzhouense]|uniref:Glycosyltransferase family 4 protein n=1 Tax=Aquamicrobium zhengzhouense TaxID=2781738 RepID=A0ABS0S7F8_9HYPH|nr:glycosyltransferase family 4 protein [Aquamicrobium zhengzhouense]MBI1619219.1 glycosyltransferase family 4 protein [Aquamicrobium zhengzhouense]